VGPVVGGREVEQREMRVGNGVARRAARCFVVALCVMVVACSLLAAISSAATRGWSPAVAVPDLQIQDLLFGPGNVPWVVFNDEPFYGSSPHPKAPQVARLTRHYALVEPRPVPSVPGYESSVRLDINQSGVGTALSTLTPAGGGDLAPPISIGVSAWRPGKAPTQPVLLTHNAREGERASIAISASGTTAVSYTTYEEEPEPKFVLDRLTRGRIVSVHEVPIPSTDKPISTEVLAASGGGFRAEWKLKSSDYLAGVETAEVSAGGVFSPEMFVPWPYGSNSPLIADGIFRSDTRGDEVAIWPTKEPPFREGVEPVTEWDLASRSAGGTWSTPQLIGTTGREGANEIAVAITPAGRFTLLWTSAQSRQMALGGAAGAQASNPMPLQRRPTGLTERFQRLALTTTGRVVAIWNTYRDSSAEELTSIEAATSTDGIHFSKPQRISPNKRPMLGCLDQLLVPDRAGGALAWWSCENNGHRVNEYARYRP
jgi:hypothetical protein